MSPCALINIQSRNWSDLTDYTGSIKCVRSEGARCKNSRATLSSARCAAPEQIYGRRVLNPDNNLLRRTITRCINRVLSPDINDKQPSLSLFLSLRTLDISRQWLFYRNHSRSLYRRERVLRTLFSFWSNIYPIGVIIHWFYIRIPITVKIKKKNFP